LDLSERLFRHEAGGMVAALTAARNPTERRFLEKRVRACEP
jgi:hypothetical protein